MKTLAGLQLSVVQHTPLVPHNCDWNTDISLATISAVEPALRTIAVAGLCNWATAVPLLATSSGIQPLSPETKANVVGVVPGKISPVVAVPAEVNPVVTFLKNECV